MQGVSHVYLRKPQLKLWTQGLDELPSGHYYHTLLLWDKGLPCMVALREARSKLHTPLSFGSYLTISLCY